MRIWSTSFAFTLLLGFLAAVPYSGVDINLPALSATGTTLNASAADVGLTMSAFVFSLAVMPLMYGPASDRFGRKPIMLLGTLLFVMGSVACALAPSLLVLMLGTGIGSEIRQPLGNAIVGGLLVSQLLTLFTTPVVYIYMDRLGQLLGRRRRADPVKADAPAQ